MKNTMPITAKNLFDLVQGTAKVIELANRRYVHFELAEKKYSVEEHWSPLHRQFYFLAWDLTHDSIHQPLTENQIGNLVATMNGGK